MLSRLLYGAQISLTVGLLGIAISFTLGLLLGGIAGYFGGFADTVIMRLTELLLSIPSLYLIIALRAVFPVDLPSRQIYLGIVGILAFIGWAGLARVIRGSGPVDAQERVCGAPPRRSDSGGCASSRGTCCPTRCRT